MKFHASYLSFHKRVYPLLNYINSECNSIKQLQKVQNAFVKGTNCTTWDECKGKYPAYATAEQLEPFKTLANEYCRRKNMQVNHPALATQCFSFVSRRVKQYFGGKTLSKSILLTCNWRWHLPIRTSQDSHFPYLTFPDQW